MRQHGKDRGPQRPDTSHPAQLGATPSGDAQDAHPSVDAAATVPQPAPGRGSRGLLAALERAPRAFGVPRALLFFDVDRFERVNDSLGHDRGEEVLAALAGRARACLRPGDYLARTGGAAFALYVAGVTDRARAAAVAERVRDALRRPLQLAGRELFLTASVGIALDPSGGRRAPELLREAGIALARAKAAGGDSEVVYERGMRAAADERLRLESELCRAAERGEFVVRYQPVRRLDLPGLPLLGFEALVRWDHPRRGLLAPAAFLGLVEELGVIHDLRQVVLNHATRSLARARHDGRVPAGTTVAVNLSGPGFHHPDLAAEVLAALADAGLPAANLQLELTERVVLEGGQQATLLLARLRAAGVAWYLDDFGTGWSSLAALAQLPVQGVKIDRSFLADLGPTGWAAPRSRALLEAVLGVARALKLEVVTEGVEHARQVEELVRLGCQKGQGRLLGAPAALLEDAPRALAPAPGSATAPRRDAGRA